MPDRSDWEALQERLKVASPFAYEARQRHAERAQVVAERMETLEGADEWATFVLHLDALLAADEAERDTLRDSLDSADVVGAEVERLRLRLQRVEGRLDARRQARALPATLREQAEKVLTATTASA